MAGVLVALAWCAAPISPVLAQESAAAAATALPTSSNASAPIGAPAAAAAAPKPAVPPAAPPPDPNEPASVYVYIGRTFWPGAAEGGIGQGHWEVAADGGQKVRVGTDTFVEFDTPPGRHAFALYGQGVLKPAPASVQLTVSPGEEVYIAINRYQAISPEEQSAETTVAATGGGALPYLFASIVANASKPKDRVKIAGPLDHEYGVWLVRESPPTEDANHGPR